MKYQYQWPLTWRYIKEFCFQIKFDKHEPKPQFETPRGFALTLKFCPLLFIRFLYRAPADLVFGYDQQIPDNVSPEDAPWHRPGIETSLVFSLFPWFPAPGGMIPVHRPFHRFIPRKDFPRDVLMKLEEDARDYGRKKELYRILKRA